MSNSPSDKLDTTNNTAAFDSMLHTWAHAANIADPLTLVLMQMNGLTSLSPERTSRVVALLQPPKDLSHVPTERIAEVRQSIIDSGVLAVDEDGNVIDTESLECMLYQNLANSGKTRAIAAVIQEEKAALATLEVANG